MKKFCDVGINDLKGLSKENGKFTKWYIVWSHMLTRCYNTKHQLNNPSYIGCLVCTDWLTASNFKKWFDNQIIEPDSQLDKDIIIHGNKIYSPNTCMFVPSSLNSLFTDKRAKRGEYPLGVNYHIKNKKYQARVGSFGKSKFIGYFDTIEEASNAYSNEKILQCEQVAEKLLLEGRISKQVFDCVIIKANKMYNRSK